jgi:hypothetical protein
VNSWITSTKVYANHYTENIEAEMKVKVRRKTYNTGSNWHNNRTGYQQETLLLNDKKDEKKTNVLKEEEEDAVPSVNLAEMDYFETDEAVLSDLSLVELHEVYQCRTFDQVELLLNEFGWFDVFTDDDIERIMRVANKHIPTIYGGYRL